MNYKMVSYILGRMLAIEALLMLLPAGVAFIYGENEITFFLAVALLLFVVSVVFGKKIPEKKTIYAREGFVIVGLAWILWSAFGALPFFLSGTIPSYVDCFFETVSGFTTTGSTILTEIEGLPASMNFWRCFTHWIGGMGVLVFVMAIMPMAESNSMFLMRAEMPGPTCDKLLPKAKDTAKIMYEMYFALSALEIMFLLFGGMTLYDAVIHTFSTAGTGGFSNKNSSIGYYDSAYIDGVITIFMLLFGVNFNLYYMILIKQFKEASRSEELRTYLGIVGVAIAIITINIMHLYGSFLKSFRYASFQVASIITTTGFGTADFDMWPELSKTILLLLMVVGACAGSTGGGMKVSRIIMLVKTIRKEVLQTLHPKSVNIVKLDGKRVSEDSIHGVYVYVICYILILIGSVLIVSLDNFDFATNFSAVLTTMNNIGPGISLVGPSQNFHLFSNLAKLTLSMDMLVGRLEIIPMLMLFAPQTWIKKF